MLNEEEEAMTEQKGEQNNNADFEQYNGSSIVPFVPTCLVTKIREEFRTKIRWKNSGNTTIL